MELVAHRLTPALLYPDLNDRQVGRHVLENADLSNQIAAGTRHSSDGSKLVRNVIVWHGFSVSNRMSFLNIYMTIYVRRLSCSPEHPSIENPAF